MLYRIINVLKLHNRLSRCHALSYSTCNIFTDESRYETTIFAGCNHFLSNIGPRFECINKDLNLYNLDMFAKKFNAKLDKVSKFNKMTLCFFSNEKESTAMLLKFFKFRIYQLYHFKKFTMENYEKWKNS